MWFLRDKTNRRKSHRRPKQRVLYDLNRREFMNAVSNIPKTDIPTSPSQPLALYSVGSKIPPKKARQPVLETTAQEDYDLSQKQDSGIYGCAFSHQNDLSESDMYNLGIKSVPGDSFESVVFSQNPD